MHCNIIQNCSKCNFYMLEVKNGRTKELTLLETWRGIAYSAEMSQQESDRFWSNYFVLEKGIYEQILANPDEVVTGTVKELAEKYNVELLIMDF